MTTVVQRSYRPQVPAAVVGMVADETSAEIGTRICETAAGLGFGLAVSQGTLSDKGCVIAGAAFVGVTVRDITLDTLPIDPLATTSGTVDTYSQYQNVGVLSRGHIWVTAMANVAAGDAVFYDANGKFTNSASGDSASGSYTFVSNPADADTVTLGVTATAAITFKNTVTDANTQCQIGPTLADTCMNLADFINDNVASNAGHGKVTARAYPPSPGGRGEGSGAYMVLVGAKAVGVGGAGPPQDGNSIALASSSTNCTVSAATMTGGTASATAVTGAYWATSAISGELAMISLGLQR